MRFAAVADRADPGQHALEGGRPVLLGRQQQPDQMPSRHRSKRRGESTCPRLTRPQRPGRTNGETAGRPQREQNRREAYDDIDTGEGQFHADAEGQERRTRCGTAEGVDEKGLLCPDPTGTDRHDRGEALRRLHQQHVAGRLLDPKAPSMNQTVARRSPHSASCQATTVRSHRAGVRTTVNAWRTRCLNSATLARIQTPRATAPRARTPSATSATVSCRRNHAKSKLGRYGSTSRLGRTPCVTAQEKRGHAEHVDHREHEARADECGVRRPLDRTMRHREPNDVSHAGGEERVHPGACDIGGVQRQPADAACPDRRPRGHCATHGSRRRSSPGDSRASASATRWTEAR